MNAGIIMYMGLSSLLWKGLALQLLRTMNTNINTRCKLARTCQDHHEGYQRLGSKPWPFWVNPCTEHWVKGVTAVIWAVFWRERQALGEPRCQKISKQCQHLGKYPIRDHQCRLPGMRHHQRRWLGSERQSLMENRIRLSNKIKRTKSQEWLINVMTIK